MKGFTYAVYFFILISSFAACSPSEKEIRMNPSIRFEGTWLFISNTDFFSYDYPKIRLNDGVFRLDYPMSIPSGEEVKLNLSSFTKSDGERFNILRYGVNDISISCECAELVRRVPGKDEWKRIGKAFYYGKFR